MKLKDALKWAYDACWDVWCVTLENSDSKVGEINCIHHCWNDIRGDEHFEDFLYYPDNDSDFQHISFQIPDKSGCDLTQFVGLDLEEEGWTWDENTEVMLNQRLVELAKIVAAFTLDAGVSHRSNWFTKEASDALSAFCLLNNPFKEKKQWNC